MVVIYKMFCVIIKMPTIYDSIELTETEIQEALFEAKKKKWFHLRAVAYWEEQKQNGVANHEEKKRVKREKYAQLKALKQQPAGKCSSPALQYQQAIAAHRKRGKPF